MNERVAIYFAPAETAPLWVRACSWLGRDPASGEALPQPVPPGMEAMRFEDLTESARRYGFHATLRSPFRLANGCDRNMLVSTMARFAEKTSPVSLGPVEIRDLFRFLAIMPVAQSRELTAFAAECVARFETCRAPLSPAERASRIG
ncbi:MAG: DUF1045 domain-containing protein, partial [Alphaproteobacteria bacterium]|nr:DUF1045 domain-containing protein [Alphaproteobacteria bacterium]